MKTKEEIQTEIEALKAVRPKIIPRSMFGFGVDNLAQLDAQIAVLENDWDIDDIYDEFDHSGIDEEVVSSAEYAREWLDGESECDSLADDWPLRSEFSEEKENE